MSTPAVTPNPQTLAQSIRSKYPGQYDDLSDYDLEQKTLAKYPQYRDMPLTPKPRPTTQADIDKAFQQQPTFSSRVREYNGLGGAENTQAPTLKDIPGELGKAAVGPVLPFLQSYFGPLANRAKDVVQGTKDAVTNIKQGGSIDQNIRGNIGAPVNQLMFQSIPFLGTMANTMGEDISNKNYGAALAAPFSAASQAILASGGDVTGTPRAVGEKPSLPFLRPGATKAYGGELLQQVASKANDLPIDHTQVAKNVADAQAFSKTGAAANKPLNDLVRRMTTADDNPISYEEARNFSSNIGNWIRRQGAKVSPEAQANMVKIKASLDSAISDVANQVGQLEPYQQGMQNFAKGSQGVKTVNKIGGIALKSAIGGAAGATGIAAADTILHKLGWLGR